MATEPTKTDHPDPVPGQDRALPATRPAGGAGPMRMGLMPQNIEDGWRLAQILAQSQLVPKAFFGKPADVLVAIELGIEIGLAPMQAIQSIAVINGRPSVWGDGFLALIMASQVYRDHDEAYEVDGERRAGLTAEDLKKPTTAAVCTFWRTDREREVTRRFSVAQAKQAGLLAKDGPWQTYPDRMLMMRARSWAGRDQFPDVLRGIRTAEEARDEPDDTDTIDAEPVRQPIQPRRVSETRATTPDAPAPDAAPTPEPAPTAPTTPGTNTVTLLTESGLQVVKTGFVRPKPGEEPFYTIAMATADGEERLFLTRTEQVYREAASFEGSPYRVSAGFTSAKRNGESVRVLMSLSIDESAMTAEPSDELFPAAK